MKILNKLKINKGYTRKPASLYRVLRKIGYYNNPEIKGTSKKHNQKYHTPTEIGKKWQIDVKYVPKECKHNAHMFYLKCRDYDTRQAFIKYMKDNDILCTFHYVPLHSAPAGIKFGRFNGKDEHTTADSDRLVRLPMYYNITEDDLRYVIEKTKQFFTK